MTNWIDFGPLATRGIKSIGFNNFFYMIKIYVHKIEHQLKN